MKVLHHRSQARAPPPASEKPERNCAVCEFNYMERNMKLNWDDYEIAFGRPYAEPDDVLTMNGNRFRLENVGPYGAEFLELLGEPEVDEGE